MSNFKIKNRLKEVADFRGVSNKLIAMLLNVHYTTVSHWMSNRYQPSNVNVGKLLDLLEVDYNDLIITEGSPKYTGLGKLLEEEYLYLTKVKKLPYEIIEFNDETKKNDKVYNPKIIEALKELEKKHIKG
ncbi:helix-turn-helix transcriptional regulator [Myroides odoratimimus]|uniref:HTH cro/C1-type domain-containing protein n=1 Tax=Myroides odoratimimus CIP 101113 TaxID=883154 RepID=A0AAV3F1R1_9FLAO|nr:MULTISPECIES: helix-turn-helix transcriptional regulator [Myroides]AJA70411.1 helix-turn-helix protein [Myroides sp. A21]EHO09884.1 hypothetical protein HMPREF9715_02249 [Myroides odoratimimus CIP 101113]MEC4053888.1 helix-turn-helix transcriptional regulator [Myroides odoratimimus]